MSYVENNGVRIYWEEHGAGEPLLLIMGIGYTSAMWFRILPDLVARHRVITYDNRGVGASDIPPGPYLIPHHASDALTVLDAAGVSDAHVLGISLGGVIATELGLSHPDRVRSLILGSIGAIGPSYIQPEPALFETELARRSMAREEGVRAMIPFTYDPATPQERIEEDIAVRLRTYPSPEGYAAQVAWVGTFESESRVPSISVPTLVMHGETDRYVPVENARILARLIPGAELVVLPHASHLFLTDQPEATGAAVLGFLEKVETRAAKPA